MPRFPQLPMLTIQDLQGARTEHAEQCAVMRWAAGMEAVRPELGLLFAVPNGGGRSKAEGGRLKAEGVKPGVPDLMLPVARQGYHGLFIEMKRAGGGRLSPEQREWRARLEAEGYRWVMCEGMDAGIAALREYLGIR